MKTGSTRRRTKTVRMIRSDATLRAIAGPAAEAAPKPRTFLVHTLPLRPGRPQR
ncbi:MAG: hypothetical protein ACLGP3_00100 [Acidobacteriota bacterium]